jgi:MipA family protein
MNRPLCLLALLLLVAATTAPAQTVQTYKPLWELGLGAGGLRLPHYRGSDQHHNTLLPVPYAVYRGEIFRATREGARAVLLETDNVDFDVSVSATAPTRSKDNRARSGMPDLAATLELGPNLNWTLARGARWKLDLRLPARAGATLERGMQGIGWTLSPVLNIDLRAAGWDWGAQAGPLYGSRRFHAYFYDVDPAYANADRPAYGSAAGYSGWRFTAGASRRFDKTWVGAFVRNDSVAGAVFENSPLIKQRNNLSFGLAVSWVLAVSDERVVDHDN